MVSTSRLPKYVCLFNSASKPILNAYIPLLDKAVAGLVVRMHSHFNKIFILQFLAPVLLRIEWYIFYWNGNAVHVLSGDEYFLCISDRHRLSHAADPVKSPHTALVCYEPLLVTWMLVDALPDQHQYHEYIDTEIILHYIIIEYIIICQTFKDQCSVLLTRS